MTNLERSLITKACQVYNDLEDYKPSTQHLEVLKADVMKSLDLLLDELQNHYVPSYKHNI